jgi:hypothetical protein
MTRKKDDETQALGDVVANIRSTRTVMQQKPVELTENVMHIIAALAHAFGLITGLVSKTTDERKRTSGHLRQDEEPILRLMVTIAEHFPQYFHDLRTRDFGVDPDRFEPHVLLDLLDKRNQLIKLLNDLTPRVALVGDTIIDLGEKIRSMSSEMLKMINTNAPNNEDLKAESSPVREYYQVPARKGAKTKKKDKPK